ncbi:MAG: hypothetical protein Q8O38_04965 [Sulfurimicrobium sp.]|nr:hypothetical protein [Sulfurimicrobium sp.]
MNQHGAGLVHDDVLAKMDALLKKHHDALARGSVFEDFPVLTEVVEEAEEAIPVLTDVVEVEPEAMTSTVLEPDAPPLPELETLPLSGEALSQLDRQIRAALEQLLPSHIVAAVDKALPVVLEEFAMQLETMVRDAVAQELQKQLSQLQKQGVGGDSTAAE